MKQIKKILRVVLPLALAGLLFWWVYKDWNFNALVKIFNRGVHYEWFFISLLLSILSMVLRGLRWHQLVEPVCPGGRKSVTILSIFVGYAANMLLPRAGEVARCGILAKTDGLSFTKTLGTVITERVFDVICLFLITALAVFLQVDVFRDFFSKNPESMSKLQHMATSPILWGFFAGLILVFFLMRKQIKKMPFYGKLHLMSQRLWEGMKSITTMKQPFLFIFYSIAIWTCYFLMFWIVKYFFTWDIPLGVLALLSGFVMGSYGVVAPVQGGIGAYHFMVIYTLVFFGVSSSDAGIFALVAHGLQTIFTLVTGLIAYILVQILKHRN
ncbi:MAG TPA: lysylphosphatidylglycerol synthase transmembrane domain-containing protein [Bacteroidales bacterium]|nr:lysylphosphatidylglycerol synthase transmembrane domain-containing protein [Bacteroidales bacterium]